MDPIFLLTTALIVSVDSFVCGFSLTAKSEKRFTVLLGISITVAVLCAATSALGILLKGILSENLANLGGVILVAIGIFDLLTLNKEEKTESGSILKQSILAGVGIGLDGAFANLSLLLIGYDPLLVPAVIVGMHVILITLGTFLSGLMKKTGIGKVQCIPPLILIALGLYKIICIFI